MAAFSTCLGSSDSIMSTTSKRPIVAKLCFQWTPGHSLLIFDETVSANFLKSFGSRNASGENLLRTTSVAIVHLLSQYVSVNAVCLQGREPAGTAAVRDVDAVLLPNDHGAPEKTGTQGHTQIFSGLFKKKYRPASSFLQEELDCGRFFEPGKPEKIFCRHLILKVAGLKNLFRLPWLEEAAAIQ